MLDFPFDPRLAHAETLPTRCYLDPTYLGAEMRAIFLKTWQWVGHAEELPEPGSYFTVERFGEPVVVTRDRDGILRALSNVCRHRASLVARGKGCTKSLQCPYHGWTYDLDGRLRSHREFEGVENWEPLENSLPEIRLEQWGSFLFINFDPKAPPLLEMLGEIPGEIKDFGADLENYRFLARREYTIECNWKVYVDNYLEGYHLPLVHPELYRTLDYSRYRVEPRRHHSTQYAPLRASPDDKALYYWIHPNWMVNIYPDNISLNLVLPLGPDRTYTLFDWFVRHGETPSLDETIRFSDQVQKEDIAICELVQKGLRSRHYNRGKYCPKRENGVHHFHSLWYESLKGEAGV